MDDTSAYKSRGRDIEEPLPAHLPREKLAPAPGLEFEWCPEPENPARARQFVNMDSGELYINIGPSDACTGKQRQIRRSPAHRSRPTRAFKNFRGA